MSIHTRLNANGTGLQESYNHKSKAITAKAQAVPSGGIVQSSALGPFLDYIDQI